MILFEYIFCILNLISTKTSKHIIHTIVYTTASNIGNYYVYITEMADGGELSAEHLELRLIQSKHDIENPPTLQCVGITAIKL